MIKRLSQNMVYVTGYTCSAIYDFNSGKVYSINKDGTIILNKYIQSYASLSNADNDFIQQLVNVVGIENLEVSDYTFPVESIRKINFAWLEVTQCCTSKCIHCYEGCEHHEVANPLTFSEWASIIRELYYLGCKEIQFIGGEPSLYERLPQLIEYSIVYGIENVSIFTNLFSISDSLSNCIINNHVSVHFSIYGASENVHDKITQVKGSFNKLIGNVKHLIEHNVNLIAHAIVMKENEYELTNIYALLANLGIKNVKYDEIRKVYGGCQDSHLVSNGKCVMTKPNFSTSAKWFNASYTRNTCWYGKCAISTDGSVYPCEFERNIVYGNTNESSLKDIVNGDIVSKYWYLNFSNIDSCRDCEYRFACRDCRPLAYSEKGNILQKNPRCTYNPYSGTWNNN